ncbi:heat-inducible transcriptional repressor HrcA [Bifidobacterium pullorum subsp. saeculare]|uniref:Heat-inducible transcription repressor HrcA n=1 Tax=Bifidobacterium pullorum subsp. saeculare TaxID=78257 RepID=A0A939B9Y3_9BIFI|nr:heat-inducible transcriptional repressor HrcA [Bifidobacterium pullorum]MBM6699321.1 heat-inducible transcriptional repressor HrcA [Bifidobacterium pullorum subsp. saeculare]
MANSRRMLVLRAVVEDYIRSQEPVGSGALTKQHDLGVSSATVRNDMAALEEEGYLTQPHTSAGRVPTEKGYRYFVDRLSTVAMLSAAQRRGIASFLSGSVSLADTLQRAARLLAQITGQVAVVAAPSLARSTLRRVELVPVAAGMLLAVVITDTGRVAQHTLAVPAMPGDDALQSFVAAANDECAGQTLPRCAARVRALAVAPRFQAMAGLAQSLAAAMESMADSERAGELYMSGASSLAHQGGLADLAPLFDALEEQVVLMKLMSALSEEAPGPGGVGVAIGSETHTPGLLNAAVVTSGYGRTSAPADGAAHPQDGAEASGGTEKDGSGTSTPGDGSAPVAFVGSIGPTHMDYAATMAAVRAVARYLTALLSPGADGREGAA